MMMVVIVMIVIAHSRQFLQIVSGVKCVRLN